MKNPETGGTLTYVELWVWMSKRALRPSAEETVILIVLTFTWAENS